MSSESDFATVCLALLLSAIGPLRVETQGEIVLFVRFGSRRCIVGGIKPNKSPPLSYPTRAWRLVAQVISGRNACLLGACRRHTRPSDEPT